MIKYLFFGLLFVIILSFIDLCIDPEGCWIAHITEGFSTSQRIMLLILVSTLYMLLWPFIIFYNITKTDKESD